MLRDRQDSVVVYERWLVFCWRGNVPMVGNPKCWELLKKLEKLRPLAGE